MKESIYDDYSRLNGSSMMGSGLDVKPSQIWPQPPIIPPVTDLPFIEPPMTNQSMNYPGNYYNHNCRARPRVRYGPFGRPGPYGRPGPNAQISSTKRPIVSVWIHSTQNGPRAGYDPWKKAAALIDTGASCGLVSRDWCEKNGLQPYTGSGKDLKGFNGSVTRVGQYIKLALYDGANRNLIGHSTFAVMDYLSADLLVGFDFITKYKLDILFCNLDYSIILKSPQIEYKLPRDLPGLPRTKYPNQQRSNQLNNSGPNVVPDENQQANSNQVGGQQWCSVLMVASFFQLL